MFLKCTCVLLTPCLQVLQVGVSVLADVLTPVTTVDSDASVYVSCAHQLMVLVDFICFYCVVMTAVIVYVSWQYRFQNQHKYMQTLGKLFKTKNAD